MIPIGVGDAAAQARFLDRYKPFLSEYPELSKVLKKCFLRALKNPPEEEYKALLELPDEDPSVIAFEDRLNADLLVFYLGRICADDFGEIITLAGNGRGVGAYKILRGMYERIVTASYIAQNPSESRPFMEEEWIQKWKLWQSALKVTPDIANRYTDEQKRNLEEQYRKAKAKKEESVCKKCGQPKTAEAWTRVDVFSMAEKSDKDLADLYGSCYQEPTFHSHPTGFGVSRRMRRNEENAGWTFQEISEKEAKSALHLAHNLVLRLLALQDDCFKLGMESEIQPRINAFVNLWDQIPEIDDVRSPRDRDADPK